MVVLDDNGIPIPPTQLEEQVQVTDIPRPPDPPPSANTLPPGAKASAWPRLDPHAREMLVSEFLALNPELSPWGKIDYERSIEPLFVDADSGDLVSLAGQRFPRGGDDVATITIRPRTAGLPIWAWVVAGGLAFLFVAERG